HGNVVIFYRGGDLGVRAVVPLRILDPIYVARRSHDITQGPREISASRKHLRDLHAGLHTGKRDRLGRQAYRIPIGIGFRTAGISHRLGHIVGNGRSHRRTAQSQHQQSRAQHHLLHGRLPALRGRSTEYALTETRAQKRRTVGSNLFRVVAKPGSRGTLCPATPHHSAWLNSGMASNHRPLRHLPAPGRAYTTPPPPIVYSTHAPRMSSLGRVSSLPAIPT